MSDIKKKTGFALLTEERRKQVAAMGGVSGDRHKYDSKSGTKAGKLSGKSRRKRK